MDFTWQYYDVVLAVIAASMGVGIGVGLFTQVAMVVAVLAAGAVAVGVMGHGLFVNGPVDDPADLADEIEALN